MIRKKEFLIILSIVAVAVFFRFNNLNVTPPGLWPDEAANGVDALKALDSGDFKIFYPDNNGREGLFINIQAVSIKFLGATPLALRFVSAVIGVLTIIGLYLLTRHLFNWQIAAIASFFMAISSWHVIFSRIGFRAIFLPFILVWAFFFLWRGMRSGKLKEFFVAGLIGGMGFYTYFSFRIAPLIVFVVFLNYWSHIKAHYEHHKYETTRNQMLRGFALMFLTILIMVLPLMFYFYTQPGDFLKRDGRPISVFAQENPLKEFSTSIVRTLGMFNFSGDYNQRHNVPGGAPQLSTLMGILFALGFIKELIHWIRRKPGHFSTIHTFLFSWFFIMLLPGFLSTEAPHALRTIGVIPVVMIFSALGFWWIITLVMRWHHLTNVYAQTDSKAYKKQSRLFLVLTLAVFLSAMTSIEYTRYFKRWAQDPNVNAAFSQKLVDIADYLNVSGPKLPTYVLINEGDVMVDGVPNNAQTIRFLTRTHSKQCSDEKSIHYITENQLLDKKMFPPKYILIPLADSPSLRQDLSWRLGLSPESRGSFTLYKK
jgi:4-amino-4-deoxy-L-arabinose transferase-like glycosyltransferase